MKAVKPMQAVGAVETVEYVGAVGAVETVETVETVGAVETVEITEAERALRLECLYRDVYRLTSRWSSLRSVRALEALARPDPTVDLRRWL